MGNNREFIQVSEVMTRRPVVISQDETVLEAAAKLRRHGIGSILVVDDKKVLGIFTLYDIVGKVVAESKDPKKVKVSEIMTKEVISLNPTQDASEAMELMNFHDVKQLPVINDDEELVGFLTLKDIMRIEPAVIDLTLEKLRVQEDKRQQRVQDLFESEGMDIDEDLFD